MAAVALICMTMTSVVFTSCGSDDNDEPKKAEFTKAAVTYTVTSDAATLGLFKVNVYGTDADGNGFVEAMSNPAYTKTVEIPVSKLPCTVELHTVATPLEDKAFTEVFNFEVTRDIDVMTVNNDDTVVADIELSNTSTELNVPVGESLSELAKRMNKGHKVVIFIDANGKVTEQSNSSL